MPLQSIEKILNRAMGLDATSIGAPAVARAVHTRMATRQLEQPAVYLEQIRNSPEELQALVETVAVHETWFFRDPKAFIAVAALAARDWLTSPAKPPMRLLSAPCSTGEEPLSLAMALIDAGLPPERFAIDAIDISAQALARARVGVYGKNSFRGADLDFRARHFEATAEGFRIGETQRARVQFRQANLLAIEGAGAAPYDVVFCRNLLIYFDTDTRQRTIEILRRLLAPAGLLFVGPGEANLMLGAAFASAQIPLAFAFRKFTPAALPVKEAVARPRITHAVKLTPPAPSPQRRAFTSAQVQNKSSAIAARRPAFAAIRSLADEGRLADAASACEEHLRREEPSAAAWSLLGLLRDASGDLVGAASCYRKALYLDPTDRETLEHLALLLERQGDVAGARTVSARALRLRGKETPQ